MDLLPLRRSFKLLQGLSPLARWLYPTVTSLNSLTSGAVGYSVNQTTEPKDCVLTMEDVDRIVNATAVQPEDLEKFQEPYRHHKERLLLSRSPTQSYTRVVLPLGTDTVVREKYLTLNQALRFGMVLEDLDLFTGFLCLEHNRDPDRPRYQFPFLYITVMMDRLEMDVSMPPLSPFNDIHLEGRVTWVGSSSMESTAYLKQELDGKIQRFMKATVVFVSRDPYTLKSAPVAPLALTTEKEKELFRLGEEHKVKRKEEASQSLLKIAPTREENLLIHDLFLSIVDAKSGTLRSHVRPAGTVWMEDTILKSFVVCQPSQRNVYSTIFGGFLMRKAFEIAWTTAAVFSKCAHPRCKAMDDMLFQRTIRVGCLLFLSAQVVYNQGPRLQIRVRIQDFNWKGTDSHAIANDCHFTFDCSHVTNENDVIPNVVPKTYAESMLYVDGKRRYDESYNDIVTYVH